MERRHCERRINPNIYLAYQHIVKKYNIPKDQISVFAGASIDFFLPVHLSRKITDVDLITTSDQIEELSELAFDFRSTPWGSIYVNPLFVCRLNNGLNIDVMNEMIQIVADGPLKGLLYRFPLQEAVEDSVYFNDIKVVRPEYIVLYKLLSWRNGVYNGWDRVKRDIKDISTILSYGIASMNDVLNLIYKFVPDEYAQAVVLGRLKDAISVSPSIISTTDDQFLSDKLSPKREWGIPFIPDELQKEIEKFANSGARFTWVDVSGLEIREENNK
jgi:hypothetical protein